jgi:hypothetical protein
MAIIDPNGLFNGDRLRKCSNQARLHWPYFFLASNGYGRLEINYQKIVDRAFAGFNPCPSQAEVERYILEYHSAFLLYLYVSDDGKVWGQWDTRSSWLNKYKTAEDRRSPAPNLDDFRKWKEVYENRVNTYPISDSFRKIVGNFGKSVEILDNSQESGKFYEDLPLGVGVGVGIGVELEKNPSCSPSGERKKLSSQKLSQMALTIYPLYPRRIAKDDALKAITKAIQKIADRDYAGDAEQAAEWLSKRVKQYAESPQGRRLDKDKIPYPATWMNGGQYDDEDSEWNFVGTNPKAKTDPNEQYRERRQQQMEDEQRAHQA